MSATFEIRIKIDRIRKVSFENVFNPDKKQRVVVFIDESHGPHV